MTEPRPEGAPTSSPAGPGDAGSPVSAEPGDRTVEPEPLPPSGLLKPDPKAVTLWRLGILGRGAVIAVPVLMGDEQRIRDRMEERDLMIADEVICGFGRTGHWFGSDRYGIRPDIMTLAKGITSGYQPLAAVMVGDRVADTLIEEGGEYFHGFTYSGHPVPCAVALANIAILETEDLVRRTREVTGPYLRRRLTETLADHPLVGEVRTEGLLGAVELVRDKAKRTFFPDRGRVGTLCRNHCFANNLVMRAVRDTMVCAPPLTITEAGIDELVDKAKMAIDATARDLAAT